MTRILIVDDEPAQLRGLSRAISLRQPTFEVLRAESGHEAIRILSEQSVDVVLTDLQMTDMHGFDLLAWLLSERPSVLPFVMTGYGDPETLARINELGAIECFHKPLDIDALLRRLAEGVAQSVCGHVQNIGLSSFMQVIAMEQKTCTLQVHCAAGTGQLFVRKGELIDARTKDLSGEPAALAILGWPEANIQIESFCRVSERTIELPMHHILMEALRIRDEALTLAPAAGDAESAESRRQFRSEATGLALRPPRAGLTLPTGALAMAVVEMSSGAILAGDARANLSLGEVVKGARTLLRYQTLTVARSARGEELEELVSMGSTCGELIRPLADCAGFVVLLFDTQHTTLGMARMELDRFVGEFTPPGSS